MNRDIKMMMSRERDAKQLREICADTSAANPEYYVTGFFMFGRFPHVEYSAVITGDQVNDNVFSGYWRAGVFQLFSATELALGEYDENDDDDDYQAAAVEVRLRKANGQSVFV